MAPGTAREGFFPMGTAFTPHLRRIALTVGFVLAFVMAAALPADAQEFDVTAGSLSGLTARVANTDNGANLRAEPSTSAQVLDKLPAGTTVALRIDRVDTVYDGEGIRWWPVSVDGVEGWIAGSYLGEGGRDSVASSSTASSGSGANTPSFEAGQKVVVRTDDGTGLAMRMDSSRGSEKIGKLYDGDVVTVVLGPTAQVDGWYLVSNGSKRAWVFGPYLEAASAIAEAAASTSSAGVATGSLMYPISGGTYTQGFGCTGYSFEPWSASAGCNFHNGIDLAAPSYTSIVAADGGTVVQAGWCNCGLGYYVEIDHGNGIHTVYGHMAETPYVVVGQQVAKGEVIGPLGSTGNSTGPHVHFVVKVNGVAVDPLSYL